MARIRVISGPFHTYLIAAAVQFRWDDFSLDLDAYRLERAGVPLALEPKAFNLLALMVRRPGHLFSKQELFETLWPNTAVTDHALTRIVAQLRRVLGDEAREARYIETVPTRGYRWVRPVESAAASPSDVPAPDGASTGVGRSERTAIDSTRRNAGPRTRFVAALSAMAVVGTLILVRWVSPSEAERVPDTSRSAGLALAVQMTTQSGLELNPTLSPTGDALAYSSDRSGTFEIYVRGLSGSAADTLLTRDGGQNVQPAWSPDGATIAYHSNRFGGIWLVPARGGAARQIVASGAQPGWSPDGRLIAFQSDEHNDVTPSAFGAQTGSTLWTVSVDTGELRQMTRSGKPMGGHSGPAWSRDARYIAFTVFEGGADDGAWLLTIASGETKRLADGNLFEIVFAPDDSALYAAGGDAFVVRLPFDAATASVSGDREVIPVAGVPGVRGLSMSSDGRSLAFAGLAVSSQIWAQPIAPDGTGTAAARPLTTDTSRRNSLATVSPDGSKVAYISTRNGGLPKVWVMDTDGQNRAQLIAGEFSEWRPMWFPDGRRVAYTSERGEIGGLFAIDLATRREELMVDLEHAPLPAAAAPSKRRVLDFELSPSFTQAAFATITRPDSRRALYVTNVDSFAPRAVGDAGISVGYPAWSPDERSIAVEVKDGSSTHAGVIDVTTGALRQLTHERGQTWIRSWSPDGRKIAAATLRGGLWSLQWIDASTGELGTITPAASANVYVRYPQWSSKNDLIVFERGELRGNIWMLKIPPRR